MNCPTCCNAELIHDCRDITYTYNGYVTVIHAVTGDFCPSCDESVLDATESNRVMREMKVFAASVSAQRLSSIEVQTMPDSERNDVSCSPLTDEEREWLDTPPVGMEWGSEEWDKEFNEGSTAKSPDTDTKSHDEN